ncbi:S8 family serine peptidase [Salmonella enterica]
MKEKYTVTYKVAQQGATYIYQNDKGKHKAGDRHSSPGGHMWYVLKDGVNFETSYGFESVNDEMRGEGRVTNNDDKGYQQTIQEITVELNKTQYEKLLDFSIHPENSGFDKDHYRVLTNSCVDFVFKSLEVIGYNNGGFEGNLFPANNLKSLHNMLKYNGGNIIRDNLTRHGEWYEEKDGHQCLWLTPDERVSAPASHNMINININTSPQPVNNVRDENKSYNDISGGYIQNLPIYNIYASGGILNNTDFTSTQMASLASGGIRPGELQLDQNIRPNSYLSQFYLPPSGNQNDVRVRNAITLNGLAAMTTFNTYIDPLLLDLNGDGVHMTDIRDGVLFDIDHSGTLKRTGWTDNNTGILVIDDGRGYINDVSQMFSEYYSGLAGIDGAEGEKKFHSGFSALASEDLNKDGVIDSRDPIWQKLRVWVDNTHDGQSAPTELRTLSELGITQINLNTKNEDTLRDGNKVTASGTFIINGKAQEILEVKFLGDPVSNILTSLDAGTRIKSSSNNIVTTAYVSHSTTDETLDADSLGVQNLYGGEGNDTLIAAKGGSWLTGGNGSNTYIGSSDNDVFVISASDNTSNIHGNGGHDTAIIVGNAGVELNMAQAGLSIAEGGDGNDTIRSGGTDGVFIKGGSGYSVLVGGMGNDVIVGGRGHNTIIGGGGKSVIFSGPSGDIIYASEGGSIIHAGGGDDKITGGYGDDVIEAGHGNAVIDGDGGVNIVSLHGKHGEYNITKTDEGYNVSDKLPGRDGNLTLKNIQKLSFSDISAVDLKLPTAMPVDDILTLDSNGEVFERTHSHLISSSSLLFNDQRLNSLGELHISDVRDATGGTVALTPQGDVLFTPDPHYSGILSFKYGISDSVGNTSASVVNLSSGEMAPMRATVSLMTAEVPSDPLVTQEWYLNDTNILPVWKDFTGKGVRIGQFEPGGEFSTAPEIFDINHPDLIANVDPSWLRAEKDSMSLPELVSDHATMVAGVMVAGKNGTGGVGVAYGATLGGYYLSNNGADLTGLGHMVNFDIANNSWGFANDFAMNNYPTGEVTTASSLLSNAQYAATNGRGGLGTVIVAAGGNNRAKGGNAQGSLTSNNRFSIEVGAINAQSDLSTLQTGAAPFSNPGASLLVSAPGSNVVSTSHILETERGSTFGSNYTTMQGTSFAAPIVSGIVALMLEANPNLGYRDVQQILAISARRVKDASTIWNDNNSHNWNNGGMHISDDYGFGEVDARAAVRLAESWMEKSTAENEQVVSASGNYSGEVLLAGSTISSSVKINEGVNVEHAEIDFDADVGRLGDVTLKLISPDGTESVLLNRQGKIPAGMPGHGPDDTGSLHSGTFRYRFMSTHDFGENSAGNWTLSLSDAADGLPVQLNSWALHLYGSKNSGNQTYFYTDEYTDQNNKNTLDSPTQNKSEEKNTLNAAAVSRDVDVNLLTGIASIGGKILTVKEPKKINNIITGDGNDTLIAGNSAGVLDGGRGRNTLTGGAGKNLFIVHHRESGFDVINNFDVHQGEKIELVGFNEKTPQDLHFIQVGEDVHVNLPQGQKIVLKNESVTNIHADNFIFKDTVNIPDGYFRNESLSESPNNISGTVLLNGGGKGVSLSSNALGEMKFELNGQVYNHDNAAADVFIVAAQHEVNDYHNALRGFRHGIDKIDLRQTGVTDFGQLSIVKENKGTINGLSQIHGVNVIYNDSSDKSVNLLYIDAIESSQLEASDFIFSSKIVNTDSNEISTIFLTKTFDKITLGDENKVINIDGVFNKLNAGNGNIKVNITGSQSEITLGNGSNDVSGKISKLTSGNGNNSINGMGTFSDITLGNGDNNIIFSGSTPSIKVGDGNNTLTVNSSIPKIRIGNGNNILSVNGGIPSIKIGDGRNSIQINGSIATVEAGHGYNNIEFNGGLGTLKFSDDVTPDHLWFRHTDQDLQILEIGGKQETVLHNWYARSPERPSTIIAGENHSLLERNVENLVQAMASFSPPTSGSMFFNESEFKQLQAVIAVNWK